ncbi:MAG TPA: hypothetical protein VMP68_10150, partial [Candidatus Eisenbacteria bacterium]|nr:hypothetical protein [Candidatus Eisenbacteria bacterium]
AWGCSNFVTGASGTSPTLTPYFQSGGQIAMSRAQSPVDSGSPWISAHATRAEPRQIYLSNSRTWI